MSERSPVMNGQWADAGQPTLLRFEGQRQAGAAGEMMSERLPAGEGEWIDRGRPLNFRFEGRDYMGFAGDTVSSALWAAGVRVLGRSFKYHRNRGILSLANHDVNAMMQDDVQLNLRGDITQIADGMDLEAVNTFGGLKNDKARFLDYLSAFLPVGFYYKAFHTPNSLFPRWEKMFRAMTGLGKVKFDAPRIKTPKRYDFADVLVIGAGPAGLSAAIAAAKAGAKVVVVDENRGAGGSLGYNRGSDRETATIFGNLMNTVGSEPNIDLRLGTVASGYYADHWVPLVDGERMTKMRARAVVVAAGAYEQPAVFRNNDLPGVMLASAAQRLIYRYAVRPARDAVVLAANSDGYRAAVDLHSNGIKVVAIVDLRPGGELSRFAAKVAELGIRVHTGHCIYEALPNRGKDGVRAAVVCSLDKNGRADTRSSMELTCDGIVMSVGWAPAAPLLYQAGTRMRYVSEVHQFVPDSLPAGVFAAGRVNGVYDLSRKLKDGERAGLDAVAYLGIRQVSVPAKADPETVSPTHPYPIIDHPKGKNFVDFDEDLQVKDFFNAAQEGFDNIELMKRFTTVGMGPSQGKHSNMNAIRILARITGRNIEEIGTTTARPFFHPVPLSHLAGRSFYPERVTPLQPRHEAAGAVFMQAGVWLRPEYYAVSGKTRTQAIRDEVRAVRNRVGMIDVGTLGKMEVFGPDGGEFLERIYTGRFSNMKIGATRYAVMVDESGVVIDDGVVARLGEQHFYFTTTTTGSATVYREMTRLNTMWGLQVGIVNVTGAFSGMNLAGPKSREVLAALTDLDVSDAGFPYLGVREGLVAGVPARLMRVGFVGELGYEIHAPADCALHVWNSLMQAGKQFDIRPFGVEAQRLLRLEKGHIIVSQDTDGLTSPYDAAMGWAVKMDKLFFVGQRSLKILQKKPRKQLLVGFALDKSYDGPAPKECQLIIDGDRIAGRVTSVAFSETLSQYIGLAFIEPSMSEIGTRFNIRVDKTRLIDATVVKIPFYDPEGLRQKL